MITAPELYKRFSYLQTKKSFKTTVMEEVDEFFTSPDEVTSGNKWVGRGLFKTELVDTTGSDLIDEYVAFVLGIQFISETRWFTLKYKKEDNMSDVNRILSARGDKLHELLGASSYYSVLTSLERDVILHGHGGLYIEPSDINFINCKSYEPRDTYIAQDDYGNVRYAFTVDDIPGFELLDRFPTLAFSTDKKKQIDENYDRFFTVLAFHAKVEMPFITSFEVPEDLQKTAKYFTKYIAYVGNPDTSLSKPDFIEIDEVEFWPSQRSFFTRDSFVRDSAYGKGIGKKALPKSRLTNKLMYSLLKLSGLQSNPPRVQHTSITAEAGNRNELQEGQVFTLSPTDLDGMDPSKAVALLQVSGNLAPLLELYQNQQGQLATLLPSASSIYKVARQSIAEIQQRFSELERRLAPLRVTFLSEGPGKHLKLFYELADKQGKFNTDELKLPEGVSINDIDIAIDIKQLQAFRQGKALRAAQALGIIANAISLKPSGADKLDIDKFVEVGFDGYNVLDMLLSRKDVETIREQQRQQIQEQQALQQQQAGLAADASNAKILGDIVESGTTSR